MNKVIITIALFTLVLTGQAIAGDEEVYLREVTDFQKRTYGVPKEIEPFVSNGLVGFKNRSGKIIIKPRFYSARLFSEGLAAVETEGEKEYEYKWGFIDASGNYVIKPAFDYAGSFSEGLAMVLTKDKCGYIDKTGRYVIESKFNFGYPFSQGLALVQTWDFEKWGYIDKSGKFVIAPIFDDAWSFCDGRALVEIYDKWGWINKSGRFIINLSKRMTRFIVSGNEILDRNEVSTSTQLDWLPISDPRCPPKLKLTREVKDMLLIKDLADRTTFAIADLNDDRVPEIIIDNLLASGKVGITYNIFMWNKGKWRCIGLFQGDPLVFDFNDYLTRPNEFALISCWPKIEGYYYHELFEYSEGGYQYVAAQRMPKKITDSPAWKSF